MSYDGDFSELEEASKSYTSTVIPLSEVINWKVHNLTIHLQNSSFSSQALPIVTVGFGATGLTKWEISLHSSSTMLQARAKLLSAPSLTTAEADDDTDASLSKTPRRVTHHLTVWIKRKGGNFSLVKGKDFMKCKEAWVGGHATTWGIIPVDDLKEGILCADDDCLELRLKLSVFGCDVYENDP